MFLWENFHRPSGPAQGPFSCFSITAVYKNFLSFHCAKISMKERSGFVPFLEQVVNKFCIYCIYCIVYIIVYIESFQQLQIMDMISPIWDFCCWIFWAGTNTCLTQKLRYFHLPVEPCRERRAQSILVIVLPGRDTVLNCLAAFKTDSNLQKYWLTLHWPSPTITLSWRKMAHLRWSPSLETAASRDLWIQHYKTP